MRHPRPAVVLRPVLVALVSAGLVLAAQVPAQAKVIKGNANDNTLRGTRSADTIYGYRGHDTLYGNKGDDKLHAGKGPDRLYGGNGHDTLIGAPGKDRLFGATGPDRTFGGEGPDIVKGGKGHDKITGGPGDDTLRARDRTRDRIACGAGKDVAVVGVRDLITDTSAERPKGRCQTVKWTRPWRLPVTRNAIGSRSELDDPHHSSSPRSTCRFRRALRCSPSGPVMSRRPPRGSPTGAARASRSQA